VVAALEEKYGLNEPLVVQYVKYVGRLVHGDLGESYRLRRPVNEILPAKLANTAKLATLAIIFEILIGLSAGILSALKQYSRVDVVVTLLTTLTIGLPVFVLGLLLQQLFAIKLGWFPLSGTDEGLRSYILPALALALIDAALVARLTRATMIEVLRADYVRTAIAKGLTQRTVVFKHVLRNSIIPVVTYLGISFGTLLGGALITEVIFNMNGIGNALVTGIQTQDNPIVLGIVTYGVAVFVLLNLVVDLLYAVLDPRVRPE
jgi:oligopeptide transport system permease protein